jgi:hypothetical protein
VENSAHLVTTKVLPLTCTVGDIPLAHHGTEKPGINRRGLWRDTVLEVL